VVRRDDRGRGALSFAVPSGSFFGLVGPIGAGETTALSMAVGLLRPDAGTARIFGHDVWTDPVRAKAITGVLPDGPALPERLTGRELLTYSARLRGLDRATAAQRADELLGVLDLTGAEARWWPGWCPRRRGSRPRSGSRAGSARRGGGAAARPAGWSGGGPEVLAAVRGPA